MATKQQKKMKKARKMREKQIKVFWGIGFLIVLAIGLVWAKPSHAAVVVSRPVIVARPAVTPPPPRVSPTRVSSTPTPKAATATGAHPTQRYSSSLSGSSSSPTFLPMYIPIYLPSASTPGTVEKVDVATPMLTKCTQEQFQQAKLWQQDCKQLEDISDRYCPILSYFRYCKEAQPDEIKELKQAGPNYKHVYLIPE
ncbi:hypothetical protein PA10_00233 [Pseudomonas phage pPa_SNUABM_DT01]|nr:hypothetical protein PA10_00233 [Pseudomonas phage pPa_SNUABM_DT01]